MVKQQPRPMSVESLTNKDPSASSLPTKVEVAYGIVATENEGYKEIIVFVPPRERFENDTMCST
jgi:hypothetical protein